MPDMETQEETPCQDIRSTSDLLAKLPGLHKQNTTPYYRGENRNYETLTPRIMRNPAIFENENLILAELMRERPGDFRETKTAFSQWMTAQHHGLPTRFLDVSKNPLVALFFACWDSQEELTDGRLVVFTMPNGPNGLVIGHDQYHAALIANYAKLPQNEKEDLTGFATEIQAMKLDTHYKEMPGLIHLKDLILRDQPSDNLIFQIEDTTIANVGFLSRIFAVEPAQYPERVYAQSGAVITSGFCTGYDEITYSMGRDEMEPPTKFRVPKECKNDILEELNILQVTEKTLFPGLDTSAKAIAQRYR